MTDKVCDLPLVCGLSQVQINEVFSKYEYHTCSSQPDVLFLKNGGIVNISPLSERSNITFTYMYDKAYQNGKFVMPTVAKKNGWRPGPRSLDSYRETNYTDGNICSSDHTMYVLRLLRNITNSSANLSGKDRKENLPEELSENLMAYTLRNIGFTVYGHVELMPTRKKLTRYTKGDAWISDFGKFIESKASGSEKDLSQLGPKGNPHIICFSKYHQDEYIPGKFVVKYYFFDTKNIGGKTLSELKAILNTEGATARNKIQFMDIINEYAIQPDFCYDIIGDSFCDCLGNTLIDLEQIKNKLSYKFSIAG